MVSAVKSFPFESSIKALVLVNWSAFNFSFKVFSSQEKIFPNDVKSGTNFAALSASNNGKSNTLAVSRMEDFAAIVP